VANRALRFRESGAFPVRNAGALQLPARFAGPSLARRSTCKIVAVFCSFCTVGARDFAFGPRIRPSLLVSQGYATPNGEIPLVLHDRCAILLDAHGCVGIRLR
jgi:hypothetical protein